MTVDGTLVLVDDAWHHSQAFDGYQHTTGCQLVLDCVDVDAVELEIPQALDQPDVLDALCTDCERHLLNGGSDA
jgi:hypothetical protein